MPKSIMSESVETKHNVFFQTSFEYLERKGDKTVSHSKRLKFNGDKTYVSVDGGDWVEKPRDEAIEEYNKDMIVARTDSKCTCVDCRFDRGEMTKREAELEKELAYYKSLNTPLLPVLYMLGRF